MVINADELQAYGDTTLTGYRLINSKFPPIDLFDDVADADEFEAVYAMQGLTNPRLRNELGNLNLLEKDQIPYGITGLYYAIGSFVHITPDGSRFSNGDYGVLYIGDSPETTLSEVKHHQQAYWSNVEDLAFERFVFRQLKCTYTTNGVVFITQQHAQVLAPDDYTDSRQLGAELQRKGIAGVHYPSVRHAGGECFGFFTPSNITEIIQTVHIEMIFNGRIVSTAVLS